MRRIALFSEYGFTDVIHPYLYFGLQTGADPSTFCFWDDAHTTTGVQRLTADAARNGLMDCPGQRLERAGKSRRSQVTRAKSDPSYCGNPAEPGRHPRGGCTGGLLASPAPLFAIQAGSAETGANLKPKTLGQFAHSRGCPLGPLRRRWSICGYPTRFFGSVETALV